MAETSTVDVYFKTTNEPVLQLHSTQ